MAGEPLMDGCDDCFMTALCGNITQAGDAPIKSCKHLPPAPRGC